MVLRMFRDQSSCGQLASANWFSACTHLSAHSCTWFSVAFSCAHTLGMLTHTHSHSATFSYHSSQLVLIWSLHISHEFINGSEQKFVWFISSTIMISASQFSIVVVVRVCRRLVVVSVSSQ